LQDAHGLNIPIILWCLWTGAFFAEPDAATMKRAIAIGAAWERKVVAPLRSVRRALKDGVEGKTPVALREQVKSAELAAEAEALSQLEMLTRRQVGAAATADARSRARRTLAAYARAAGAAESPGFSIALLEIVIGLTVPAPDQDASQDQRDT
jgi:uncharacterized protein (TIGR02444 family)